MTKTWKKDPTSWRTTSRPVGWKKIRQGILHRDNSRCTWVEGEPDGGHLGGWSDFRRCTNPATDVDHIGAPDNHSPDNLRSLCGTHHRARTARQAAAARVAKRATRERARPPHPGLLPSAQVKAVQRR